ncbi:MAG: TIGR01906 family membrane protein [Anaerolineales bacterium]|nr:TIGR01906 family membrane protein [Anaerolineales bacterium]
MKTAVRIFLTLAFPLVVFLAWVRIMLLPFFVEWEYRRPGFPPDSYGFTTQERIRWANISREYLLSDAGGDYFAGYRLANGSPLYNEREVEHMVDVQVLVRAARILLTALGLFFLAGCGFLLWKDRTLLRRTLAAAGIGTFGFLVAVLIVVGLAWDWAFVTFHHVFFTGETWLFPYTDTLIRLFPVTFWQDGFIAAAAGMLSTCLAVWFIAGILPRLWKRRKPAA